MSFQWHVDPEQMIIDLKKKAEQQAKRIEELEAVTKDMTKIHNESDLREIERLTAENERLLILKKACENWMDICGCCCESDTESLHDGTRITQLGIKDALDALQDKNTSTSEQVQVSLTP